MGDGIDQGAIVVLAVDLDQGRADGPQHLDAHRLVVDEGAGAPVRNLNAAQDQVAVDVDIGLGRDPAGRMVDGAVEHGGDLALRSRHGARGCRRRARRGPARKHRAGWICRRRFRP